MFRCKKFCLLAVTSVLFTASNAEASAVTWTGPSDFEDWTIGFTPFVADTLVSFTGDGIYHEHNSPNLPLTVKLDVRVGGVWTNLFTHAGILNTQHSLAATLPAPISFVGGTVDALRLTGNPDSFNTFHRWNQSIPDVFTFANNSVPEPTSMALFGLTALGLGALRRRKRNDGAPVEDAQLI